MIAFSPIRGYGLNVPHLIQNFGERLRELRKDMDPKPSQEALGLAVGIGRKRLITLEKGRAEPRFGELVKLAEYFRLQSIEELFGELPSLKLAGVVPMLGKFPSRS